MVTQLRYEVRYSMVMTIIESFRIISQELIENYDRQILGTFKPSGHEIRESFIRRNFSSVDFMNHVHENYSMGSVINYVEGLKQELNKSQKKYCFISTMINILFWLFASLIIFMIIVFDLFVAQLHMIMRNILNYDRLTFSFTFVALFLFGLICILPALRDFRNHYLFGNAVPVKKQIIMRRRKMKD